MGNRRKSREFAVQLIYMFLMNSENTEEANNNFWKEHEDVSLTRDFSDKLYQGVCAHKEEIESWIKKLCINWELDRLVYMDRSILMLALYEMIFLEDIPYAVSINEALELAKKFSNVDSSKFINGVLDNAKKELEQC